MIRPQQQGLVQFGTFLFWCAIIQHLPGYVKNTLNTQTLFAFFFVAFFAYYFYWFGQIRFGCMQNKTGVLRFLVAWKRFTFSTAFSSEHQFIFGQLITPIIFLANNQTCRGFFTTFQFSKLAGGKQTACESWSQIRHKVRY